MNVSRSIDVISPYANCPRPLDALQSADSFGAPESELTELDCGGIPWTKKGRDERVREARNGRFVSVTLSGKKMCACGR